MTDDQLVFNGINGATGDYLLEMTPSELSQVVRDEKLDEKHLQELKAKFERANQQTFAPMEGVDPKNLAETGWGVVFAWNADQNVNAKLREALSELLDHRKRQAGAYYREFDYRPGESKQKFLERYGAGPGPADPKKVPYYLMLVGDPTGLPFRFQYQLDVQYAVGRLHFPTLEEYAQYARSVVTAERSGFALARRAVFVGVCNPDDKATQLSSRDLITPLADYVAADQSDWKIETLTGDDAKKASLQALLGGAQTPALLFTASHGMGFPKDDPRQLAHQGALLCQDWPGQKEWRKPIPPDFYLSADDIADDASLLGLIAFHFACYGAGTPELDDFAHMALKTPTAIAPHPFVARLPQRLLGHPKGGALAVLGHVERAWGYSFTWGKAGPQRAVYESTVKRLLEGHPVGSAIEFFNERYAELSSDLSMELENIKFNFGKPNDLELAGMWTANNDARSFVIIGDPAVRLVFASGDAPVSERPSIELVTAVPTKPAPIEAAMETPIEPETLDAAPSAPQPAPDNGAIAGDNAPLPNFSAPLAPSASALPPITVTVTMGGQTVTATPSFGAPPSGENEVASFGLFSGSGQTDGLMDDVSIALRDFTKKLSVALQNFVTDMSKLEVTTYVSDDIESVQSKDDLLKSARLRAFTRIKLDGDTEIVVPSTDGGLDDDLWAIHVAMVQQAQVHRAELLKTAVSAASGLAQVLKVL